MQIVTAPEDYRQRAGREVQNYARTLGALQSRCGERPLAERPYLGTRLAALREHLDYTQAELLKLPTSLGDPTFTPAHAHFHRTLRHLEAAFAQATEELSEDAG